MTIIATAGHVDHGKSSLVRAITGTDPDRLSEEKRRGLTIDLGFAHVSTPRGITLSFVDVPGHSDFIRTMISGVSGVSIAVLVVDAAEGWKPQTEEHLGILSVLKISHGVIVLTKCDKVEENELLIREQEIAQRISHSSISWSRVFRTSTVTHSGIDDVIEYLEKLTQTTSTGDITGRPRLFVDRVFSIKGSGTVVTGTLEGGSISVGDELMVVRSHATVSVREVQQHGAQRVTIQPGSRCALNLSGIEKEALRRGDSLIVTNHWHLTTSFDAQLETFSSLKKPITHRGNYMLHIGTHVQEATLRIIRDTNIAPGESAHVRIRFAEGLPLRPGDHFLIRETGIDTTIGGGIILDVDPRTRLSHARPDGTIESQLVGRGFIDVAEAQRLTGKALTPRVGQWCASDVDFEVSLNELLRRLDSGPIDVALLENHEQALLAEHDDVLIERGIARRRTSKDPLLLHPYVELFRVGGLQTTDAAQLDRNVIRQLVQRNVLYEHDNIAFHVDVLLALRPQLEELWAQSPNGFTMSQFRELLSITRKHAVPLAHCLDKIGLTKRNGDVRVPGYKW